MAAEVIVLVALIKPPVRTLPPVMLAVALTTPLVVMLPPVTLAVALINPPVVTLAPAMLPVAVTKPAVTTLEPTIFPVAETIPNDVIAPILTASYTVLPSNITTPNAGSATLLKNFHVLSLKSRTNPVC